MLDGSGGVERVSSRLAVRTHKSSPAKLRTTEVPRHDYKCVRKATGLNLLQANGPAAAQSVMHFHMHVLPRREGDDLKLNWGLEPGDMDAIGELAERIRSNL